MKGFFKKAMTVLLSVLIIFSAGACNLFDDLIDSIRFNGPHMSERAYQRIDRPSGETLANEAIALAQTAGNLEALLEKRNQFFDLYYEAHTMYTTANINMHADSTSTSLAEECAYAQYTVTLFQQHAIALEKAILTSPHYKDYFLEQLGEDYAASILAEVNYTDEQLTLLNEIAQLDASYAPLLNEYDTNKLAELMTNLIKKRNEFARSLTDENGVQLYDNYIEYAYANDFGRSYTPDDAELIAQTVIEVFAPINEALYEENQYNTNVPFIQCNELMLTSIVPSVIKNTSEDMFKRWTYMQERGLCSLSYDPKKSGNSFVTNYAEFGDAFLFVTPSLNLITDVSTLLHEFGHYYEVFTADPNKTLGNNYSYDLAEAHSQGYELISLPFLEEVLSGYSFTVAGENDQTVALSSQSVYNYYAYNTIHNMVFGALGNAMIDNFERIVYSADENTLSKEFYEKTFADLNELYAPDRAFDFYSISHVFNVPGYCISYTVSMLLASEIWASKNPTEKYLEVVTYGMNNTLDNVCTSTDLALPTEPEAIKAVGDIYESFIEATFPEVNLEQELQPAA